MKYILEENRTKFFCNKENLDNGWVMFDADGLVLGRLATTIVMILKGKNKPTYTPNADCGDSVVVINCTKIKFTGKKATEKLYRHHSEHPGGMKVRTSKELYLKDSSEMLYLAVKRMLGKGPLAYKRLTKLRLFNDSNHKHEAQNPVMIDFKSKNRKNS